MLECKHGNHTYLIQGNKENEFFKVIYPYSLIMTLANVLNQETVKEMTGEKSEKASIKASEKIISEIDLKRAIGLVSVPKTDFAERAFIESSQRMNDDEIIIGCNFI